MSDEVPHPGGRVVAFDDHRGLGEIATADGARYPFHCTAIADGSRTIDEGVDVTFELAPGLLGRWEAVAINDARTRPDPTSKGADA